MAFWRAGEENMGGVISPNDFRRCYRYLGSCAVVMAAGDVARLVCSTIVNSMNSTACRLHRLGDPTASFDGYCSNNRAAPVVRFR